jgi:hypothetical protein
MIILAPSLDELGRSRAEYETLVADLTATGMSARIERPAEERDSATEAVDLVIHIGGDIGPLVTAADIVPRVQRRIRESERGPRHGRLFLADHTFHDFLY